MTFTENALKSKEAKEAIGEGILSLLHTGNLDTAVNKMIEAGRKNGSLTKVKAAFILDILKELANRL